MNQFLFQQGDSRELYLFPHIIEIALKKNHSIQLNSLPEKVFYSICIYYVIEGKFEWVIDNYNHILYPGDVAVILPGQRFGGRNGFLDIGTLSWINIRIEKLEPTGKLIIGKWSSFSENERLAIGKIFLLNHQLVLSKLKETGILIETIKAELVKQEIGYFTRVNQLIDELLILIARQLTHQNNSGRDFPQTFMKLEQTLRKSLSHQWTVEEMAALVGLGTTAFNEKVKSYTGFSPLNYLINIRISEAIKFLKRQEYNVTQIALDTGFYSSQHFSTTFKKLTGYTPSEFRKNNSPKT